MALTGESCPQFQCHAMVWLEEAQMARLRASGELFFCWHGHSMSFAKQPPPPPPPAPDQKALAEIERLRGELSKAIVAKAEAQKALEEERLPVDGIEERHGRFIGVCPSCGARQPRGSTKKAGARHWLTYGHLCPDKTDEPEEPLTIEGVPK